MNKQIEQILSEIDIWREVRHFDSIPLNERFTHERESLPGISPLYIGDRLPDWMYSGE